MDLATLSGRQRLPVSLQNKSGMERLNSILDLAEPAEFIQGLGAQELYLMMRGIGTKDAYVLLEHASDTQLKAVMDLEVWHRDELQVKRWLEWLALAKECNLETALRYIKSTEDGLIQLLLSREVHIHGSDLDQNTVPDELQIVSSPDGLYFFTLPHDSDLAEQLRELLKLFWMQDKDRIRHLCATARFELQSSLQESLYRFRNGRLEDMGLLSAERAAELYEIVHPPSLRNQIRSQLDEMDTIRPGESDGHVGYDFVLSGTSAPNFLAQALEGLDAEERSRFGEAFAYLANKVFVAKTRDHSHIAELPTTTRYAAFLVGIGLAYLSDEGASRATEILRKVWPEQLFRAGHSLTMEWGLKARRIGLRAGTRHGLYLFGEPKDDLLAGMCGPQPMYYSGLDRDSDMTQRPFESLEELDRVAVHLRQMDAVLTFFEEKLGFSPDALLAAPLEGFDDDAKRLIRLSTLFRTGLAQLMLSEQFAFTPLARDDLAGFLKLALAEPGKLSAPVLKACEQIKQDTSEPVSRWIDRAVEDIALTLGRLTHSEVDERYAGELFLVRPTSEG